MNTRNREEELEHTNGGTSAKSVLAGLVIGGLVGAGTMLLLAPQPGEKTRAEIREGALRMRDETMSNVKGKVAEVRSKTDQITSDVKQKAEELQKRSQDVLAEQLDKVSAAAEAGKKALKKG